MNLFGYDVTDLQQGIVVGESAISGTLHYISDYSSAFGPGMDSGNYLAIHADVDPDKAGSVPYTITVTVTNPVELDEDKVVVLYIADKNSQTVTVVASAEGYEPVTKVFTLRGLDCEAS